MNSIARLAYAATFLAGISFATTIPAQATAFAGVSEAIWGVGVEYLPDGITFSCFGGAYGGASSDGDFCGEIGSLTITNDTAVEITKSLSLVGGFTLTNNTDADIELPLFSTGFSAFNPGGSEIGASVDDPAHEYAAFSSFVYGPGVGDVHSCGVGDGPDFGVFITPTLCGVDSPDSSFEDLYLGTLDAGQTLTETYFIDISATARGVPEPTTLAIFGTALFGAMAIRRRKSKAT